MNIGYVRVSDASQNLDRQIEKMLALGIEDRFLFIDKQSGKDFQRADYQAMLKVIREGDLIYVDALDRLGRNYEEVINQWKFITRTINADIVVLENEILFDSRKFKSMGDLGKLLEDQFLSLLSFVADQERKRSLLRQKEGIAAAKKKGVHLGRPRFNLNDLTEEQGRILIREYPNWQNGLITAVKFMDMLQLKKNTFYKITKEYTTLIEDNENGDLLRLLLNGKGSG